MADDITDKYIIIGKLGKIHGLNGWLNLYPETKPADKILDYKPLYCMLLSEWQKMNVDDIKSYGNHFLLHIQGIDNPEDAKKYVGKEIAILRDQLAKLRQGEYYWTDLEGVTVINQNNIELGTIDHLMETGSNDVMVVVGKKRYLIPYIRKQVIIDIDLDTKIMHVNWDEEF